MRPRLLLGALVTLLAGCGRAPTRLVCQSGGLCTEYLGGDPTMACTNGTMAVQACPATGRVGRCEGAKPGPGTVPQTNLSFYAPNTTASARDFCSLVQGATFTAD